MRRDQFFIGNDGTLEWKGIDLIGSATIKNQLRADRYRGHYDCIDKNDNAHVEEATERVGHRFILHSMFSGSPHNMQQIFQDALAIVRVCGKPDLFVAFTCNPNWQEIKRCLPSWQIAAHKPYIVCRVFNFKLKAFM